MTKHISKLLALLLSMLMLFSGGLSVFASSLIDFQLDSGCQNYYKDVTYEIQATISNLPESALIETNSTAFKWSSDGKTNVVSSNNYSYSLNDDGTYTVTESAKFNLIDEVGSNICIQASYADDTYKKNEYIKVLQPITSMDVRCVSASEDGVCFIKSPDGYDDRLYVNADSTAEFKVTSYPLANDDRFSVNATGPATISYKEGGFLLTPGTTTKAADFNFNLNITPGSGYKYQKTIKTTKCVPLKKFSLSTGVGEKISAFEKSEENPTVSTIGLVQGEPLILTPKKESPTYSNDGFEYNLYFRDINGSYVLLKDDKVISIDTSYVCTLNIKNPGSYILTCDNISPGDGVLERNLRTQININVVQSNPLTSISFKKLDANGKLTDQDLENIDLYLNAGKSTYDISKHLLLEPEGYTDNIFYTSDNTSIAKVDRASGLVTGVSSGRTYVYAISSSSGSVVDRLEVNVKVGIAAINGIAKEFSVLPAGHRERLTLNTTPANHDETISWSSLNPDVLTVDKDGYITANPDYNFDTTDEVLVGITASSQFGKTITTYITVVPAVPAQDIDIAVSGSGMIKEENGYSTYAGSNIELSANATGISGNKSNDVLTWKVVTSNGNIYSIDEATNIFSKIIKGADGSYIVTPSIADKLQFICYAIKSGEDVSSTSVRAIANVEVRAKATRLTCVNPNTSNTISTITVSCASVTPIKVSMSDDSAYTSDPFECYSNNEEICTVKKTDLQTFEIHAGKIAGVTNITVKSKSGSKTATLKVSVNNNIALATFTDIQETYVYTGYRIEPNPTIIAGNTTLFKSQDYTVAYSNQTNVGVAKMSITGKNSYSGSNIDIYYNIIPKDLGSGDIDKDITCNVSGTYSVASANNPVAKFNIKYGSITLKEGIDYTVTCSNNSKAGTAKAVINGKGNYSGYFYTTYQISDKITNATISPISNQVYDGKSKCPKVKITYKGATLKENVDYTLTYSNNTNIGKGTVKVSGKGNFNYTTTAYFYIVPAAPKTFKASKVGPNSIKLVWTASNNSMVKGYQVLNANTGKQVALIEDKRTNYVTLKNLLPATGYKYKVREYYIKENKKIYGESTSVLTVYTKPLKLTVSKVSASKKAFSVKWKTTRCDGYQIQYSTNKNFKTCKSVYVDDKKAVSKKVSKLKSKKTYYVRIRAYKNTKINGKAGRSVGSWSTIYKVKIK